MDKKRQILDEIKTSQEKVKKVELKETYLKRKCVNYYNTTMEVANQKLYAISNEIKTAKNNKIKQLQETQQAEIKKLKRKHYYIL